MQKIPEEIYLIFTKTIVPALVAISVGLAVKMKKVRVSIKEAFLSIVIGVGFALLLGGWIHETFEDNMGTMVIALVTITGEKIGYWLVFKFDFDRIGQALQDMLEYFIRKK